MPDLVVTRWGPAAPKAEQRLEGGPRLPATVGPEDKLIEVDLELPTADPVVSPHKPVLKVAIKAGGAETKTKTIEAFEPPALPKDI